MKIGPDRFHVSIVQQEGPPVDYSRLLSWFTARLTGDSN